MTVVTTLISSLKETVWRPLSDRARAHPYLSGLGMTLGALLVAQVLNALFDVPHPSRLFLVAILLAAVAHGLWPAIFASLISALFYDFFFLPPRWSLSISSAEGLADFAFFVATALIVTALAARVRRYAVEADKRALTAEKLSTFSRDLAGGLTIEDVLDHAARYIGTRCACRWRSC